MQQERTKVAVDAMGGDNAPAELVKGAVDAVNGRSDIKVLLVGQQDVVNKELEKYTYPKEHRGRTCGGSDRDGRAAGERDPQEEAVVYCSRYEYGETEGSRCFRISRKFRCDSCRRTGDRRKNPWNRTSAACTVNSDRERCVPSD